MSNSIFLEICLRMLFLQFLCPHLFITSSKTLKVQIKGYIVHKASHFIRKNIKFQKNIKTFVSYSFRTWWFQKSYCIEFLLHFFSSCAYWLLLCHLLLVLFICSKQWPAPSVMPPRTSMYAFKLSILSASWFSTNACGWTRACFKLF